MLALLTFVAGLVAAAMMVLALAVAFAILDLGGSASAVGLSFAAWTVAQVATLVFGFSSALADLASGAVLAGVVYAFSSNSGGTSAVVAQADTNLSAASLQAATMSPT